MILHGFHGFPNMNCNSIIPVYVTSNIFHAQQIFMEMKHGKNDAGRKSENNGNTALIISKVKFHKNRKKQNGLQNRISKSVTYSITFISGNLSMHHKVL
jgi:hypothetical protein